MTYIATDGKPARFDGPGGYEARRRRTRVHRRRFNAKIILGLILYCISIAFLDLRFQQGSLTFVYPLAALTFVLVYGAGVAQVRQSSLLQTGPQRVTLGG